MLAPPTALSGLSILSVGEGDTKLTFDPKKPAERDRAAKIVTDMIRAGYAIMVQVGKKNGEPLYQRAKGFDPKTCEYLIVGFNEPAEEATVAPAPKKGRKAATKRLAAGTTPAVAVARSAGG